MENEKPKRGTSRRALVGAGLGGALLAGMPPGSPAATRMGRESAAASSVRDAAAHWDMLQCIYRCARGMDRHDAELMLSAYHDDAMDDHGFFVGPARDFVQRSLQNEAAYAARQHFIMNHLAEIDGDAAHAETYYMAAMRRRDNDAVGPHFGRYVDRFERRAGRWAIAARAVVFESSSLDPAIAQGFGALFLHGTQDRDDISYRRPLDIDRPPRDIRPKTGG